MLGITTTQLQHVDYRGTHGNEKAGVNKGATNSTGQVHERETTSVDAPMSRDSQKSHKAADHENVD